MYSGSYFHIGFLLIHYVARVIIVTVYIVMSGEHHQNIIVLILLKERIVLVGKCTPQAFHSDKLTPFQFLKKRNTVEQLTMKIA